MRPILCSSFAWSFALASAFALAACGGAKKNADSPGNGDDTAGEGGADTPSSDSTPTSSTHAPGDDTAPAKAMPCGGLDIPDLAATLSQTACEVAKPDTAEQKDLKGILEVKAVPDSTRVASGSSVTVTLLFRNKGKGDLPLNFVIDPLPRFDFELYTLKGTRADAPAGDAPSLPPEVANAPVPDPKVARITLVTQGTAKLTMKWNAVKYKWASKERAKGALPGHGYPREPAGPLPKGTYVLRVVTPLTNVFEGVDHEVSQPRVQITVGPAATP